MPQLGEIGAADTAAAVMGGGRVGGLGEPPGDGRGEGGDGEAVAQEVSAVHGSPEGRGDADGVGGSAGEIQPQVAFAALTLEHVDLLDRDGPPETFSQRSATNRGTGARGIIPSFTQLETLVWPYAVSWPAARAISLIR
ncbi:hypothetical protein [Streptomyces sp. NPDC058108]|uniref:hypothetical protein n=1 Tax=Streptomyces sp. NPDC058108 TaxID=3346344 RepID=UPI0036EABE48